MIYSEPGGDYFKVEGNIVKINMDGKKVELDSEKVKMVGLQRSTLLNCLSGNWEQAAADNNAELTITEEKGLYIITLFGLKPKELEKFIKDFIKTNHLTKVQQQEPLALAA